MRGSKMVKLLEIANMAVEMCAKDGHNVSHVLVVQRFADDKRLLS